MQKTQQDQRNAQLSRKELISVDKIPKMSATQFGNYMQPGGTTRVITATNGRSSATAFAADSSATEIADAVISPSATKECHSKGWHLLN